MDKQLSPIHGSLSTYLQVSQLSNEPETRSLATKLSSLPSGTIVEARVLSEAQDASTSKISMQGEVVDLKLPSGFKQGDSLEFEVIRDKEGTALRLLTEVRTRSKASLHQREQLANALGLTQESLKEVTKAFRELSGMRGDRGVSQEVVQVLQTLSNSADAGSKLAILDPQAAQSSESILRVLRSSQSSAQRQLVSSSLSFLDQTLSAQVSPEVEALVTTVKQKIGDLLSSGALGSSSPANELLQKVTSIKEQLVGVAGKEFEAEFTKIESHLNQQNAARYGLAAKAISDLVSKLEVGFAESEPVRNALRKLVELKGSVELEAVHSSMKEMRAQAQSTSSTEKLLALLNTVELPDTPPAKLSDLKSFVSSHIGAMKEFEGRVREVLSNTPALEPYDLLLRSLAEVERRMPDKLTELDRKFVDFVKSLKAELQHLPKSEVSAESGQVLLRDALQTIRKDFLLQDSSTRSVMQQAEFAPRDKLSSEFQLAAKKLDAQLRVLLSQSGGADKAETMTVLKELLKDLQTMGEVAKTPLDKALLKFAGSLEASLNKLPSFPNFADLSKILSSQYEEFTQKFGVRFQSPDTASLSAGALQTMAKLDVLFRTLLEQSSATALPAVTGQETISKVLQEILSSFPKELNDPTAFLRKLQSMLSADSGKFDAPFLAKVESGYVEPLSDMHASLKDFANGKIGQDAFATKLGEVQVKLLDFLRQATSDQRSMIGEVSKALGISDVTGTLLETERLLSLLGKSSAADRAELIQLTSHTKSQDLIKTLKTGLEHTPFSSSADESVKGQMKELLDALVLANEESQRGAKASTSKDQLQRQMANLLAKYSEGSGDGLASQTSSNAQLEAFRSVENLLKGQEMLRQLNPIMQAVGEPAMLLFPSLLPGMLSQIEVMLYPNQVLGDGEKNSASQNQELERAQVNLELSGLGKIQVQLLRRDGEMSMAFHFEDKEKMTFAKKFQPLLRRALSKKGVSKLIITMHETVVEQDRPSWFKALQDPDVTVA